jgi:hypothetical protein
MEHFTKLYFIKDSGKNNPGEAYELVKKEILEKL